MLFDEALLSLIKDGFNQLQRQDSVQRGRCSFFCLFEFDVEHTVYILLM